MTRPRSLVYALLVAVVVFYYLATPTLRTLFGPVAVLPAYAAVGILAGAATYGTLRYLGRLNERLANAEDDQADDLAVDPTVDPVADEATPDGEDPEVEQLLGEFEAEREE